jgi:hypothetical protein
MDLQPHQQRVVDEKRELDERRRALGQFLGTTTFAGLPTDEQGRLKAQAVAMHSYANILGARIEAFANGDEPMVVFRRMGAPSDANPLGMHLEDVAIPESRLGEITIEALPRGMSQRITKMTRAELDAQYPRMVRL